MSGLPQNFFLEKKYSPARIQYGTEMNKLYLYRLRLPRLSILFSNLSEKSLKTLIYRSPFSFVAPPPCIPFFYDIKPSQEQLKVPSLLIRLGGKFIPRKNTNHISYFFYKGLTMKILVTFRRNDANSFESNITF